MIPASINKIVQSANTLLSEIKKISILPDRQKLYSQQMINYDTQIR
mgnify:FL=1